MLAFAGLIYSALLSFVLSSASRNRREGRAHAPMLIYVGYVMCGLSAGGAALLPVWAAYHPEVARALMDVRFSL
ncbi:MAG: hypothetical protein J0G94_15205 [Sphingomonadales bacterium]|nr:hypothetical protein [Sphingomonadales bacterium]